MEELLLAKFGHCLAKSDPDVLVLRRQDGAFVAAFSARGATREGIVEAVKEDYGRLLEANAALSGISYTVFGGNSARDALSETSQGFQPSSGKGPAYNASEKLQLTKTEDGARVTLNWVYAEENYVSIGYQVEDLKDNRQVAGHPAELQPLLGFGYGKPTPREKEYFKKYNLGTDIVALTDERGTKFRMVDNSMETSGGPKPVEGPLENLVAFKPKEGLKPSKEHDFRLQVPLYESASLGCKGSSHRPSPSRASPSYSTSTSPCMTSTESTLTRRRRPKASPSGWIG